MVIVVVVVDDHNDVDENNSVTRPFIYQQGQISRTFVIKWFRWISTQRLKHFANGMFIVSHMNWIIPTSGRQDGNINTDHQNVKTILSDCWRAYSSLSTTEGCIWRSTTPLRMKPMHKSDRLYLECRFIKMRSLFSSCENRELLFGGRFSGSSKIANRKSTCYTCDQHEKLATTNAQSQVLERQKGRIVFPKQTQQKTLPAVSAPSRNRWGPRHRLYKSIPVFAAGCPTSSWGVGQGSGKGGYGWADNLPWDEAELPISIFHFIQENVKLYVLYMYDSQIYIDLRCTTSLGNYKVYV